MAKSKSCIPAGYTNATIHMPGAVVQVRKKGSEWLVGYGWCDYPFKTKAKACAAVKKISKSGAAKSWSCRRRQSRFG